MLTDKLSIAILQLFPGKHQSNHCKAVTCDHEQEGEKHACRDLNTSSYKCWCAGWHSHVMTHIDNRVHSQVFCHNWGQLLCCPGRLLSSLFCIYVETGSWFQCIGTHCMYLSFFLCVQMSRACFPEAGPSRHSPGQVSNQLLPLCMPWAITFVRPREASFLLLASVRCTDHAQQASLRTQARVS